MYSYGPPHMAKQKQDDQLEHTYSSYVKLRDVALKTCLEWWMIGRSGERGSGISVLAAQHDDDDEVSNWVRKELFAHSTFCQSIAKYFVKIRDGEVKCDVPQSTGAEEDTDCISAEGGDYPNESPAYDIKLLPGQL